MTHINFRKLWPFRSRAEQAAEWVLILEDPTAEEQANFDKWMQSTANINAFISASQTRAFVLSAIEAKVVDHAALERIPAARDVTSGVTRWATVSVTLVVLATLIMSFGFADQLFGLGWQHHVVAEDTTIKLPDGSKMDLQPGTSIDTRFSDKERELRLLAGAAKFEVAHDESRHFRVHAGRALIEAVGTRFTTREGSASAMTSVEEGTVAVSIDTTRFERFLGALGLRSDPAISFAIDAGQGARVTRDGRLSLKFDDEKLAVIVAKLNGRSNAEVHYRLANEQVGETRVTLMFEPDDLDPLIHGMRANHLKVTQSGTEILISQEQK